MFVPRSAFAPLAVLWVLNAACVLAQGPTISQVRIGVDGHFKRGHWAEVQVTLHAWTTELAAELEVISRDGDGAAVAFVRPQPVQVAPDETTTVTTLVKMGPPRSGLQVRITSGGEVLAQL